MRPKQSYHTSLIVLHHAGLLPAKTKSLIPKTTLSSWKNRDLVRIVGVEQAKLIEENTELLKLLGKYEKMLSAAKVLLALFRIIQQTLFSFKEGKRRLFEAKNELRELINYSSGKISVYLLARLMDTSVARLKNLALTKSCHNSPFGLCKRIHPGQLAKTEINSIRLYLLDQRYLHWPLSSVYFQMMRDKAAFCSLSAFYKYARKLGISRIKHVRYKDRNRKGLRADFPLQIIHADFTMLRMQDHSKVYFHFIADNFSRKIIKWSASLKPDAATAAQNLKQVLESFSFPKPPVLFITDDGSENKGQTAELFEKYPELIEHKVAQRDIIFSNSMIESVNKSVKYYHFFPHEFSCFEEALKKVPDIISEYNSRPTKPLNGLTPDEAFKQGRMGTGMFKEQLNQAMKLRIQENKAKSCGVC
ncbi:MAG: transposase [Bacteroidia bacterium]